MSRTIRLGIAAAGLALAASVAWAAPGRSDERSAGGEVWYDEFYTSQAAPTPTPVAAAASRGHRASTAAAQRAHKSRAAPIASTPAATTAASRGAADPSRVGMRAARPGGR